eukprot:NODE_832_length_3620_cov_0.696677.p4 type:complete len:149 gc:universal NODE_832_length_3620_cov_0.696677:782-1228(+)
MARQLQPDEPSMNLKNSGKVVKGFGRGSKDLGIPTANLEKKTAEELGKTLKTGIYYGYAYLHNQRYSMVMSFGWNPFYKNTVRSCEVHLITTGLADFYDEILEIRVLGYIRPELDYTGVQDLIRDIELDIETAQKMTCKPSYLQYAAK